MAAEPARGQQMRERRDGLGLSREQVAHAMRKSAKTLERWEKGLTPIPPADERALAQFYERYERTGSLDNDVPRGTPLPSAHPGQSVRESSIPIPRKLEIMALDFEREALQADADEEFMRYARGRLRDPALFEMYAGGHSTRALTAAEQIDDYAEVIEDLRRILRKRQRRFENMSGKVDA